MRSVAILLISMLCLPATAQQRPATADHSLLWCISGNGLGQPSFIFGTEHMICTDKYVWKNYMEHCFGRCKKLCTELDLSDASLPAQIGNATIDKTGKELRSYYKTEDYQTVRSYFLDSLHRDLDTMQHYKPFFLQALAFVKIAHCDSIVSYELRLMQKARKAKMKITGLETVKEQSDVVDPTSPESATRYLLFVAAASDAAKYEYSKMQASYTAEDVAALYGLLRGNTTLLDNRNKKWIPGIEKMIRDRSVFFAVGAAHLWGEHGVISLLRKEGYSVIPIKRSLDDYPCASERNTVNGKVVTKVTYTEGKPFKDGTTFIEYPKRSHGNISGATDQFAKMAGYDVTGYLQSHLQIPAGYTDDMDDIVTVSFDINNDGKTDRVRIRQGIGSEYDEEAIRLIKNMPPWKRNLNISGVVMPIIFRKL